MSYTVNLARGVKAADAGPSTTLRAGALRIVAVGTRPRATHTIHLFRPSADTQGTEGTAGGGRGTRSSRIGGAFSDPTRQRALTYRLGRYSPDETLGMA